MSFKDTLRTVLGYMPLTAEIDWALHHRDHDIRSRYRLPLLKTHLADIASQMAVNAVPSDQGKKIFFFASWHGWITHSTLCALALRGLGYGLTLGYVPIGDYDKPVERFDLRLQDLYTRHVLETAKPWLKTVSFLDLKAARDIPEELVKAVEQVTIYDTQYTRQREDVTGKEPIYFLRLQRNFEAARKAYAYFQENRPDVVVVPNGMIQEYGAVHAAARALGIETVTFEYSELDQYIWIDQNRPVMFHFTNELWSECEERILDATQDAWLDSFLLGRQGLTTGDQFAHLWQNSSRAGGKRTRSGLGLNENPVVLLPTNVLGDSATLGRTIFSESMEDWVKQVVRFFKNWPEVQLVVRIHPAETWTVGPSVAEIIRSELQEMPPNIHLIGSTEQINTYDLMEIADLALVYTTTAGLEMAIKGIPVVVSGNAHYRGKGFTLDADTWEEYFSVLDHALKNLPESRLTSQQIKRARNYAYFYFREYPLPFPWHLEKNESDLAERPVSYVLSSEGRAKYETTFHKLAGSPIHWLAS